MGKSFLTICIIVLTCNTLQAQDTAYSRMIIDTLASGEFHGRGYTNEGLGKAMKFLQKQFLDLGLQPVDRQRWIQQLSYPVNTFHDAMMVKIDGKELRPGYDFIIAPDSRSIAGTFDLIQADSTHFVNSKSKLIVSVEKKLTWSVARRVADSTTIKVLSSVLQSNPGKIEVEIKNDFIRKFKTGNICGMVQGTNYPDSFIVFSAHYDHLGEMGKEAYFPGANDNASGVSMLLGLAKYFSKHPPPVSIAFLLFTGEEAGLIGSEYFVNHPIIPLQSIRFLVNLDLTGTGVDGIMVVNATEFEKEFQILIDINQRKNLLQSINERGKAKNSDHYWFTEKGVRSFFIYTLGGIKAYHDVYDIASTLPNNEYADLHKLLTEFVNELSRND